MGKLSKKHKRHKSNNSNPLPPNCISLEFIDEARGNAGPRHTRTARDKKLIGNLSRQGIFVATIEEQEGMVSQCELTLSFNQIKNAMNRFNNPQILSELSRAKGLIGPHASI